MEAVNAHLTDSTALNMPVPTILIPAKKKPIKYNFWAFFCLLASSYIGIIKCFPGVISHKIGNREIPAEHKKEKEGQLNYNRLF